MKNTFLNYIKLTLALVLFLQVGEVSGQSFITWNTFTSNTSTPLTGTYTGGTVTASFTGTGNNLVFYNPFFYTNLNSATGNQAFTTQGPQTLTPSKSLTLTFSTPVFINELNISDIDLTANWNDTFTFSGVTFTSVTGANCTYSLTGASATSEFGTSFEYARWLTSTTPVSSFTINFATTGTLTDALLNYAIKVTNPCAAFTTVPTLSATTINNSSCASGYINLNSLVSSTTPSGASLKWYKDNTHTTEVTTPTAVGVSGTYYAFYVDTINNCYSPASAAVTATYTACPLNISSVCPATTVDLATRVTGTAPTGYTYTYHSATPATTANKLTTGSIVSTSGTYYVATYFAGQDCYTTTSRPIVVTITNCCATLAAPTWN